MNPNTDYQSTVQEESPILSTRNEEQTEARPIIEADKSKEKSTKAEQHADTIAEQKSPNPNPSQEQPNEEMTGQADGEQGGKASSETDVEDLKMDAKTHYSCMESLSSWDGTLTAEQFRLAALCLASSWESLCPELPHWHWESASYLHRSIFQGNVQGYLVLEDMLLPCKKNLQMVEHSAQEGSQSMEEFQDLSAINADSADAWEYHMYTYHIIYSDVYKVPVLYFCGHCLDGRRLSWEEVHQDLPQCSQELVASSRWTFLTQEDHPYLHRPWFSLHPCWTSHLMSLIFSRGTWKLQPTVLPSKETCRVRENMNSEHVNLLQMTSKDEIISKYFLTWLSFSGGQVGLKLSSGKFKEFGRFNVSEKLTVNW